jgi:hypothetical protein
MIIIDLGHIFEKMERGCVIVDSVSDPDSLSPDPDPAFFFRLNRYRSGSRIFITKIGKNFQLKKKLDIFGQKLQS